MQVRPALKKKYLPQNTQGVSNFDRNFPSAKAQKAWGDKNKDEFFRKKYAHVHAYQKKRNELKSPKKEEDSKPERPSRSREAKRTKVIPFHDFIHGRTSVLAALYSTKRSGISMLYTSKEESDMDKEMLKMAELRNIPIQFVTQQKLDQITSKQTNNGYALRTRPLEPPNVDYLVFNNLEKAPGLVSDSDNAPPAPKPFSFQYDEESNTNITNPEPDLDSTASQESTNGTPFDFGIVEHIEGGVSIETVLKTPKRIHSHAVGLYIDEVTDPHNMGAILRSAQFLGIDFGVVSSLNSSKLSPTVSKVSAGALELFDLYSCESPLKFFEKSRLEGWNIIAAVPSTLKTSNIIPPKKSLEQSPVGSKHELQRVQLNQLKDLSLQGPCLLVVGSEGQGLRKSLLQRCTHIVSIENKAAGYAAEEPDVDNGNKNLANLIDSPKKMAQLLDSLNVSVATAILLSKLTE